MGCCGLTAYGRRELVISTAIFALACLGLGVSAALTHAVWLTALAAPAAVYGWVLWFFRDPERTAPPGSEGGFVSPADGTVSDITPVGPDSPLGCEGTKIGIFMSIFSVHVNRSPCDGRVESIHHQKGAFLDARDPLAGERNEAATIRLRVRRGRREYPVVVRQVAGLVARRILTDLTPGQDLTAGQRIGMIKFGSRLELLLPRELAGAIAVRLGQRVQAGRSLLASAPAPETQAAGEGIETAPAAGSPTETTT